MTTEPNRDALLAEDEDYLESLQFALGGGRSTEVALLAYETPRQLQRLRTRVADLLPECQHLYIDFTGAVVVSLHDTLRDHPAVQAALANKPAQPALQPQLVVHVSGLEGTLLVEMDTKENRFLPALNMERESFFRELPFIKILWVTKWEVNKIRLQTRDFYSWLSLKHDFKALPDEIDALPSPPPDPPPTPFYTPERKKYVENLENRLANLGLDTDPETQRNAANLSKLLGYEYDAARDYTQSVRIWKKALAHLQRYESSDLEKAEVQSYIGHALTERREFAEAEEWLLKAKQTFEEKAHWKNWVENEGRLGRLMYEKREWQAALTYLHNAVNIAPHHKIEYQIPHLHHLQGMIYAAMRDFAQALENYQKALEWYEKTGQLHQLGSTFHQIGRTYEDMRQYTQALENYQKALEWKEKTGQLHELGGTFHQIGIAYADMHQYTQALENYQKALEWKEKTGQLYQLGSTFHQIGIAYADMRQYPQALENYQKALEWNEKKGQLHELGGTYYQIGKVYEDQKDFYTAEKWYQDALANLQAHNDPNTDIVKTALINIHHAKQKVTKSAPAAPTLRQQKEQAEQYYTAGAYEKALPLYQALLQHLQALPEAQREEDRDDIAAAHLRLGVCYYHRAGDITRSTPEKENLETAYSLAHTLIQEGDTLSLPLYLEAGYWLLRSQRKEIRGFFPSKTKKAAWQALQAELLAATTPETTHWHEQIAALSPK